HTDTDKFAGKKVFLDASCFVVVLEEGPCWPPGPEQMLRKQRKQEEEAQIQTPERTMMGEVEGKDSTPTPCMLGYYPYSHHRRIYHGSRRTSMEETSTRMKIRQAWKNPNQGSRVWKRSQVDLKIEKDTERYICIDGHKGHERGDREPMSAKESREIV
ncbi:MAG: hypothetical protein Q9177_003576, partial [Variospora cf. flavescens]